MKRLLILLGLVLVCFLGTASNAGAGPPGFPCTRSIENYRVTTQIVYFAGQWYQEQWVCYAPNWWGPYFYAVYSSGGPVNPMGADRELASAGKAAGCYYGQVQYIGYPYILRCNIAGDWILLTCYECYHGGGGCFRKPGAAVPAVAPREPETIVRGRTVRGKEPPPLVPESACM